MFWTSLALGLWIVLGGFISYYGDLQGRRWGKKRVSLKLNRRGGGKPWFSLRPKYTAVLITSLTGGFIALLSIITLLLIAPDIRNVVLRGESAVRENQRLIAEQRKERLQNQYDREQSLAESKKQHEQQIRQAQADQKQVAQYQKQLAQEQAKLPPLRDSVKALQTRYDTLQAKHNLLSQKLAREKAEIAQLKQDKFQLNEDNVRATAVNKALGDQNYKYEADNLDLEKKNKTLQALNTTLQEENVRDKKIQDTFKNVNFEFYQKNVALEKEINEKQQKLDGLTHEVANLTQQRDDIFKLIGERDHLLSEVTNLYSKLRQSRVRLQAGVELSRQPMDAHQSQAAIKKALVSLVTRAGDEAQAHGAAPGDEGRAALLLPQKKYTLTGYELADEDSQINALAQQWSGNDVKFVVVASTVTNCLQGEPVYMELHPYPVVRVYKKGDVVASRQIDGHAPNDKIINELIAFLQKDVTIAALKNGTIPRVDPQTGENEVGVLGAADLFNLLERVRRIHGPVLLTAKAKQDLSSADPLNLTFHVERVKIEKDSAILFTMTLVGPMSDNQHPESKTLSPAPSPGATDRVLANVLAIDPGRSKCGLAVVTQDAQVLFRAVVPTDQTLDEIRRLIAVYLPSALVIGMGTGSRPLYEALKSTLSETPLHPVDESHTSEAARIRYVAENPPRGLQRLLPRSLRTPSCPYDDYVAVILAERYWQK